MEELKHQFKETVAFLWLGVRQLARMVGMLLFMLATLIATAAGPIGMISEYHQNNYGAMAAFAVVWLVCAVIVFPRVTEPDPVLKTLSSVQKFSYVGEKIAQGVATFLLWTCPLATIVFYFDGAYWEGCVAGVLAWCAWEVGAQDKNSWIHKLT